MRCALLLFSMAAAFTGAVVPATATVVRGEFAGTFTESALSSGGVIPEIAVGASFVGFFEYDTADFEYSPASGGAPAHWDFGAVLTWSTGAMVSRMERLSAIVTEDSFRIVLAHDAENPSDSINGDAPWYFHYNLSLDYSEPLFDSLTLPIAAPLVSKLDRAHLSLLGYTNDDTMEFGAVGEIDLIEFGAVPEPATAFTVGMGVLVMAVAGRGAHGARRFC